MSERDGNTQGLDLTISLCLTYTLCIVCVRLWIRKGAFGFDDLVVLVTTVFSLAHIATDYVALANGLGKPWEELIPAGRLSPLNQTTIAGIITFGLALYLSKICVLAFLCRITKNKKQIHLYYASAAVVVVLGLISVLTVTLDCHAGSGFYWSFNDNTRSCPSQLARWQVFTAFDVVTEILLLALPLQLVWNLQMPLRKKAMVLTAFYLRAPVIGLTLVRNYFTLALRDADADAGQDGAVVVIWMEIELAYALAASTLSALKAFTESFNSGFGQGFTRARGDHYDLPGMSKGSVDSSKTEKNKAASTGEHTETAGNAAHDGYASHHQMPPRSWTASPGLKLRPDSDGANVTRVSADPGRSWKQDHNGSDCSRDELYIVRETELSVHHDEAPILGRAR